VLAIAAASLAGCVSMPDSGPTGQFSASPQATAAHDNFAPVPSAPQPGWTPTEVVQGFLLASASYPDYSPIARQYLLGPANKTWSPTWSSKVFSSFTVHPWTVTKQPDHSIEDSTVEVSGVVQAKFGGSGQFVLPQTQGTPTADGYQFKLSKVNGQWRIANPPSYRLLTVPEFAQFYKPQDLYFASPVNDVLVPYSVFVPLGVPETSLVGNLVKALIPGLTTQKIWLQSAVATIPAGTTFRGVTIDGSTAVVSLGGALAHASQALIEQVSAQLVWTLTGPPPSPSSTIQSVELVINGKPWTPPQKICGTPQSRSYVQNQDMYSCYDPYPAGLASFSFTSHGQVWSRCGSEREALQGFVGSVVPVFGPSAVKDQQCHGSGFVLATSKTVPSSAQIAAPAGVPSLVAVSPNGQYVACFSAGKNILSIGSSSSGSSLAPVQGNWTGVKALSWDRNDNLWVAQGGSIWMVTAGGKAAQIASYNETVADLSVAPDGVRMALILQDGAQSEVELAAIVHGGQSASDQQRGAPSITPSIGSAVQLGPNLVFPDALTWYDADNLIVLDGTGSAKTLYEVSVDGQDSSTPQPAPAGAISVAADSSMNALVVGLEQQRLSVSTGLEGPWQPLGVSGQNPAYPG
jgi:hypothetical protein